MYFDKLYWIRGAQNIVFNNDHFSFKKAYVKNKRFGPLNIGTKGMLNVNVSGIALNWSIFWKTV